MSVTAADVSVCLQSVGVKLQPPSGSELPAFNPIMPPAAITQILLIANPNKVATGFLFIPIRLHVVRRLLLHLVPF